MFLKYQDDINIGWKKFIKPMDIKKQRNNHYCKNCNDNGYRVKMDYLGNHQEKEKYTMYDVSDIDAQDVKKYTRKMVLKAKVH